MAKYVFSNAFKEVHINHGDVIYDDDKYAWLLFLKGNFFYILGNEFLPAEEHEMKVAERGLLERGWFTKNIYENFRQ